MANHNIYSIAEKVGMSPSTVARALRPDGKCSEKTRKKILEAAESMGYVPSASARNLRSKTTQKILFCIPDIYNAFYFGMIHGASEILEQHGYYPILCHTGASEERELEMLNNLRAQVGDGMIFVSFDFTQRLVNAINDCGMPVVITNLVEHPPKRVGYDCVYINTYEGTRLATNHLIRQGHVRIGYVGGDVHTFTGRQRLDGYLRAMSDAGLAPFDNCRENGGFTREGGFLCGRALIGRPQRPTGIVAANDLMALGVMEACKAEKLRIPQDVCIVGMDNTVMSEVTTPPITSVIMREEEIGRMAAAILMERIHNSTKEPRTIMLTPDIVIRESSLHNPAYDI